MTEIYTDEWRNCFGSKWNNLVVPDAFDHPAKFSRGLIKRIYEHAHSIEWIRKGSMAVDPFGGVAIGALDAMFLGASWVGCELEQKFHKIGNANIELWKNSYGNFNNFGDAELILGDSRKLSGVVNGANLVVSSLRTLASKEGQIFNKGAWIKAGRPKVNLNNFDDNEGYGKTEGQLSAMKEGSFDLAVTSPPYEGCGVIAIPGGGIGNKANPKAKEGTAWWGERGGYGDTQGQLGYTKGDEFWGASRLILEELFKIIVPGGHAIFNTKAFVRKKAIVDFPDQWKQLCEAVGFKLLHEHHAIINEEHGTQLELSGGEVAIRTNRKSFFRTLMESKGAPRVDYEVVHCFERPEIIIHLHYRSDSL